MSIFTYDVNEPHDRISDIANAASQIRRPSFERSAEFAKQLQEYHWDNRRITSHGTYFGDPTYQWLAHIPRELAELLDRRHPGWDSSEEYMREVLANYPQAKVLPEDVRK